MKYKVCVYAICKNEVKFAKRWYDSMKEADYICVLDTGSDDGTCELLSSLGAIVKKAEIVPWRFDIARNESLKLIPEDTDICVCTDIDEVFDKGWRSILEKNWSNDTKRMQYKYTWSFKEDGSEDVVYLADKIHSKGDFIWTHPVHEVLKYTENDTYNTVICTDLHLSHYPDKTKSRGQYLELLELSVSESPDDDRNTHYLGREYMFYGRYDEAIETLKKHLSLKTAVWKDERSASMRYIARCYAHKNMLDESLIWYYKAICEAPYIREPYVELSKYLLDKEDYEGAVYFAKQSLKITDKQMTYISENSYYKETPYDILSVAYYALLKYEEAYNAVQIAHKLAPNDKRISENLRLVKEKFDLIS